MTVRRSPLDPGARQRNWARSTFPGAVEGRIRSAKPVAGSGDPNAAQRRARSSGGSSQLQIIESADVPTIDATQFWMDPTGMLWWQTATGWTRLFSSGNPDQPFGTDVDNPLPQQPGFPRAANGVTIGQKTEQTQTSRHSTAIGGASLTGDASIAIGWNAANGDDDHHAFYPANDAIVIGTYAHGHSDRAITIGRQANNHGYGSIAIGDNAYVQAANDVVAIGTSAQVASVSGAVAIGHNAQVAYYAPSLMADVPALLVDSSAGIAVGEYADAKGTGISIGSLALSRPSSVAVGLNAQALAEMSIAIGEYSSVSSNSEAFQSIAIGYYSGVGGRGIAIGTSAYVSHGIAIGEEAASYSSAGGIAIGDGATVSGYYSAVIGADANSWQDERITVAFRGLEVQRRADMSAAGAYDTYVVLYSPSSQKWRVGVDDYGVLIATPE